MVKISDLLVGCRLLRLTLAPAEVNRRRFSDSREIKMEPAVRLILVASPLLLVEKSYCPHLCHLLCPTTFLGRGNIKQNLIPCHKKADGIVGEVGLTV